MERSPARSKLGLEVSAVWLRVCVDVLAVQGVGDKGSRRGGSERTA